MFILVIISDKSYIEGAHHDFRRYFWIIQCMRKNLQSNVVELAVSHEIFSTRKWRPKQLGKNSAACTTAESGQQLLTAFGSTPVPAARRILVRAQRRPESSLPLAAARQFSQYRANSHSTGWYNLLRLAKGSFGLTEYL
jgi:hypothetical protein